MNNKEFKQKYCSKCGSQRCTSEGEWLEGCPHYAIDKLYTEVTSKLKNKPPEWRDGQFVFNYLDQQHGGVATAVQVLDKIDCFYNDSKINDFIAACAKRLAE